MLAGSVNYYVRKLKFPLIVIGTVTPAVIVSIIFIPIVLAIGCRASSLKYKYSNLKDKIVRYFLLLLVK